MPLLGDIFTRGRGGHPLMRRHFVFRRFLRDRRASVDVDNVFLFWRKYEKKMRRKWRTKPPYGEITAIRKWRLCIRGMFPVTLVLSFPLRVGWELWNAVYPPTYRAQFWRVKPGVGFPCLYFIVSCLHAGALSLNYILVYFESLSVLWLKNLAIV